MNKLTVPDFSDNEKLKNVKFKIGNHISNAVEKTLKVIDEERSGKQLGLYSRWKALNIIQGKYFRFRQVNLIASGSGHGKSYVANMLASDFTELEPIYSTSGEFVRNGLNQDFKGKIAVLYFSLEQDEEDEVARSLTRITDISYTELMSSEYDYELKNFKDLDDDSYDKVSRLSSHLVNRPIYYFTDAVTCNEIFNTCVAYKKTNPDFQFIVFLDHTFLIKREEGEPDGTFVGNVGGLLMKLKKLGFMVNALHQMNQNIQNVERLTKSELHFPKDSDIHFVNQIKWACDNIYIFPYRPEYNGIKKYSPNKIDTDGLIVCSKVKSRRGFLAEIYFKDNIAKSTLKFLTKDELDKISEKK